MKINCDVLVVGAGPAGLVASLLLSKKGFSVVILEKNNHIGNASSKFDITEGHRIKPFLDELKISPNKISSKSEWISKNNIFILDSKIQDFYFKRGNTSDSLEHNLYLRLQKKTDFVTFLFDSEIDSIKTSGDKIEKIISKNNIILPQYVIFADGGNNGDILREKNLDIDSSILASFKGFGGTIQSSETKIIPHAKINFDSNLAPGGYVYSGTIESETFACIVIDDLFSKKTDLKKNLIQFVKKNFGKTSIINYFTGKGISGLKNTSLGNLYFVGGSAFFHDPFLGYGLNYAIESAYYAAQSIIEKKDELYKSYSLKIQDEFKKSFFAREIWRKADDNFFDRLISALNGTYEPYENDIISILDLFQE